MNVNCGTILDGEETGQPAGQRIFDLILKVASGSRTKTETFDFGSAGFVPWPLGVTVERRFRVRRC
ncbi:D-galactarate dehydratase/altronate hydrolase [Bosea psychrotolerans]|uniref:D-galactarate dehydratase/altronate hydrolase n=1 Tax=Bosea psychrotolerans TaxID=1871628 RepID=A0A2S4M133_9HYPH|nr:D-galactarate dehydratase/altronate hydrolase [Bosea psychrotolerans]